MANSKKRGAGGASRASMADVAALAGVSKGTVSHVLNHPDRVAPATLERVERAIAELGFVPHGTARSLALGSVPVVGLMVSDVSNSLFRDVLDGVEAAVEERQAYVMLASTHTDLAKERRYLAMFESMQMLGTIAAINSERHYRSLVEQHRHERPLVFIDHRGSELTHCSVHAENREGGALAARHLIELGRTRLAVVVPPLELQPVRERLEGFEEAIAASGASIVERAEVDSVHRPDGWAVGQEWLPRIARGEIDGIFAMADQVAAGIAHVVVGSGRVRVPEDVAIVGYDDNKEALDSPVPLTTVRQAAEEMGRVAAGLLFEEAGDAAHEHRVVGTRPALVVRASTAGS